jgi:hypothetical protein
MLDEQTLELRTIDGVSGKSKESVFFCANCDEPAARMFGAKRAKPTPALTYLIYCPKCKKVLGSWDSREQQERELLEFSKRT